MRSHRPSSLLRLLVPVIVVLAAAPARSEPDGSRPASTPNAARPPAPIFLTADRRAAYDRLLDAVLAAPDRARLRAHHDLLASEPHIAGTPGGARGAERLAALFRSFGLEVETPRYTVLLSVPVSASVSIVSPQPEELPLKEPAVAGDAESAHPDLPAGFNAYSSSGEATAEVVYANFGSKEDFERLAALGVDVRGRIVMARQGGNFRGFKAKFAEAAGAAALIIYPDPRDNGFAQGLPYPEGGYYNEHSIHRGSLPTLPYSGDPLTPGVAAVADLAPERRLKAGDVDLPSIPVQPVSWGSAQRILSRMQGPPVPREWQGGLPFTYRLTGGAGLTVRVAVEQRRELRTITNVIGTLKGSRFPEQSVILGAHHDAWNIGADDPLSGTIVVVEAARAFMEASRAGLRPARTLVFAGWDAEEWGIIGSSEWVEEHAQRLTETCLAYINLDAAVSGHRFDVAASPSLQAALEAAARLVTHPNIPPQPWERFAPPAPQPQRTVFEAWLARAPGPDGRPRAGTLGGGSDHVAFLSHLGVPCAAPGFGGGPGTQWHTNYDNLRWYRGMMGDDYSPHAALTSLVAAFIASLADADVPPFDPARAPGEALRHLDALSARARALGVGFDPAPVRSAFEGMAREAEAALAAIADAARAGSLSDACAQTVAAALIRADRAWRIDAGLPGRPWHRNLFVAPDEDSGYASWPLPLLRVAVERKDAGALDAATRAYAQCAQRVAEALRAAAAASTPSSAPDASH